MSMLTSTIPTRFRPLFPGEIRVVLDAISHHDGKWFPGGFEVFLQYSNPSSKLKSVPTASGQWDLRQHKNEPIAAFLQSVSLTGGITQAYMEEQFPGLVDLFGEELAAELHKYMLDTLGEFPADYASGSGLPQRWLRFDDPIRYNDMVISLTQRYTYKGTEPFSAQAILQDFMKAWTDPKYGSPVHLAWITKHRSSEPGPDQEAYDADFASLVALEAIARPATERQLAAV